MMGFRFLRTSMNNSHAMPDRLTISRLMVLMAGLGFSLAFLAPRDAQYWPPEVDRYRELYSTVLIGLSLPGLIYGLPSRRRRVRQGMGSLLWLALALAVLLLMPPAIGGPLLHAQAMGSNMAVACLHYLLPLMSLWMLLAGWLGGSLRWRHLRRSAPWRERFGVYLGLAWSLQGLWLLGDFYWDAFFK
jgi:hypothetical protein